MDEVVTRLYATMDEQELSALTHDKVMTLLTVQEKQILATRFWMFDVSVPVIVSIMHHEEQSILPFWLQESGFHKTDMVVRNEQYTYQVWQKSFDAGRVKLGINGFDKHRPHYFVAVDPQNPNAQLKLSRFFPENQYVDTMDISSFTYHDWDELVLTQVPEKLRGHKLLTTIRGRAREAHLINAFRKTPFPSSQQPDQILLTWSDDPRTTQSIQWRTNISINDGFVRYWEDGSDPKADFIEANATHTLLEDRLLQNDRYIHRFTARLNNLKPATTYHYILGSSSKALWNQQYSFNTAPEAPTPFTFVYFGDTHNSPHWGRLINKAFERHPHTAFYSIGGDMVGTGLYRDDWDHLFNYSSDVFNKRPLMPALGNHDSQDGLGVWMFLDLFDLPKNGPVDFEPERAYSFEYSNALFLILDVTEAVDEQIAWLENRLSKSKTTWKFTILHFPPYVYGLDYEENRVKLCDVLDKYHVDMVLSGHVHHYMRSKPIYDGKIVASPAEGTIYIISIGIPNRERNMPQREFVEVSSSGEMLYQTFDISYNKLIYKAYNLKGQVRDELVIVK